MQRGSVRGLFGRLVIESHEWMCMNLMSWFWYSCLKLWTHLSWIVDLKFRIIWYCESSLFWAPSTKELSWIESSQPAYESKWIMNRKNGESVHLRIVRSLVHLWSVSQATCILFPILSVSLIATSGVVNWVSGCTAQHYYIIWDKVIQEVKLCVISTYQHHYI